jgi:gluconokinase
MIVIIMGVAGCGKTTVGELLAARCGWKFFDADNFHPPANIAKMTSGAPLNDQDREPWLASLNQQLRECEDMGESAVLACSALKQAYRDRLAENIKSRRLVYLRGDYATIQERLRARPNHYMKAGLLESQFQALQEPVDAWVEDVSQEPETIVESLCVRLCGP